MKQQVNGAQLAAWTSASARLPPASKPHSDFYTSLAAIKPPTSLALLYQCRSASRLLTSVCTPAALYSTSTPAWPQQRLSTPLHC